MFKEQHFLQVSHIIVDANEYISMLDNEVPQIQM